MKGKLSLMAAALIAVAPLHAQQKAKTFSITPKVGITVSNFSNDMPVTAAYAFASPVDPEGGISISTPDNELMAGNTQFNGNKYKAGFTVGAESQYQFSDVLGLLVGAFFTQQGAKYNTKGNIMEYDDLRIGFANDVQIQLNSITVPVLINAYVWKGLAVKAGLQPEFAVSKKVKGDMTVSYRGKSVTTSLGSANGLRTFSLSLPVGISYEYKHIVADLRYGIGLTNLNKPIVDDWGKRNELSNHNSTFSLTLGYKFQL